VQVTGHIYRSKKLKGCERLDNIPIRVCLNCSLDGFPVITCEDDGIGIPEEAKEKIFRREYFKNSGLGLFLSREILAITGMTIKENGKFGEGARFEIHVREGNFRHVD